MEIVLITISLVIGFFIGKARKQHEENVGEAAVRRLLVKYCRKTNAHVLNNITLPWKNGTTQIDHIILSSRGILVIETKHYRGWLYGQTKDAQWTQVQCQQKRKFQNPLRQNYKHVQAVRNLLDFLPPDTIRGIAVFTGAAVFKTKKPADTYYIGELKQFLDHVTFAELNTPQIEQAIGRIEATRLSISRQTDIEHAADLERKFGEVEQVATVYDSKAQAGNYQPKIRIESAIGRAFARFAIIAVFFVIAVVVFPYFVMKTFQSIPTPSLTPQHQHTESLNTGN